MWLVNGTTLSDWKEYGQNSLLWIHGKRQSVSSDCSLTELDSISVP
jgi:hypothetical protein